MDANGADQFDPAELSRLLRRVGAPPLAASEEHRLFGTQVLPLSWAEFVDRLLLS